MKRKILLFIIACMAILNAYAQNTTIEGYFPTLKDSTGATVRMVLYQNDNIILPYVNTIQEINGGKFTFKLDIEKMTTVGFVINKYGITNLTFPGVWNFIVAPGDQIKIEMPDHRITGFLNLSFSGKGAEKIKSYQQFVIEQKKITSRQKPAYQCSPAELLRNAQEKISAMDSILPKIRPLASDEFRNKIWAAQVTEIVKNTLQFFKNQGQWNEQNKMLFTELLVNSKITDRLIQYSDIATLQPGILSKIADLNDMLAKNIPPKTERAYTDPLGRMEAIAKFYKNQPRVREMLCGAEVIRNLKESGMKTTAVDMYEAYHSTADRAYPFRSQVEKQYMMIASSIMKGTPFNDFTFTDINGRPFNLKELTGKAVVIDLWFNGCSGCMLIKPHLETIERLMKNENVQFISLSIDKDAAAWHRGIGKYSSGSAMQLFTDGKAMESPIIKKAFVRAMPELLILDTKGNFFEKGLDPRVYSEEELVEQIRQAIAVE